MTARAHPPIDKGRIAAWLLGIVIAGGLIAALLNFAELERFVALARAAEPAWLIAAVVLQLSTYVSVAGSWAVVLKAGGTPRPLKALIPLGVSKLFADQAVPTAGMSGNLLLVDQLVMAGVPRGQAVTALLLSIAGYYAAYAVLALAVLALLWLDRAATPLIAGTVSLFLLVALALPTLAFRLARLGRRPLPPALMRIGLVRQIAALVADAPPDLLRDRVLLARTALLNGLVFLADAATLQMVLFSVGEATSFQTALIAFIMASIVVTLGPVPLGLGSFEAVSIGMLRLLGVPLEAAVAGVLLLRGLSLWLPLVPGLLLTRRYLARRRRRARKKRSLANSVAAR